jgi:hypothetical protein
MGMRIATRLSFRDGGKGYGLLWAESGAQGGIVNLANRQSSHRNSTQLMCRWSAGPRHFNSLKPD